MHTIGECLMLMTTQVTRHLGCSFHGVTKVMDQRCCQEESQIHSAFSLPHPYSVFTMLFLHVVRFNVQGKVSIGLQSPG